MCNFPTIQNVSLIVLKHYLLDFNWYRAITQCTRTVNVLTTKLGIKIVPKCISTRRSKPSALFGPKGHSSPLLLGHVCCGYSRPSQLLLSSCLKLQLVFNSQTVSYWTICCIYIVQQEVGYWSAFVVSAIFLLPVWVQVLVTHCLSPFLGDRYK